ncbi:MAG: sigma-70 family RNA polymerase sigma factor [Clostridia bacterium]|nr:sigma-70 family RNA polymerase sigma factor [Clostridia bacterium]
MQSFPKPLSSEEEAYYLSRYKAGDIDAKNILVERNLRLVAHIVKKYASTGRDSDELIAIGIVGLVKAVNTFKTDKGSRLGTYAARCIDNAILTQMRLWSGMYPLRAEKNQNGVFLPRLRKICISFAPPRTVR